MNARYAGPDWVMWEPCGCPSGVCVASYAPSEDAAWREFYPGKAERAAAKKQGVRIELMTHEQYSAEVFPLMTVRCPHVEQRGEVPLPGMEMAGMATAAGVTP